ncbi:hypothetical protein CHELA40_10318 [Chelatococcus asaccharovorans]|nr:hypothetical protein CHELA40_10318 [Chelatococcus asaccharovorans]CAH1686813.1 hypothetical protein CHELA17_65290 [Chelatococcus asaccharovorans]
MLSSAALIPPLQGRVAPQAPGGVQPVANPAKADDNCHLEQIRLGFNQPIQSKSMILLVNL